MSANNPLQRMLERIKKKENDSVLNEGLYNMALCPEVSSYWRPTIQNYTLFNNLHLR